MFTDSPAITDTLAITDTPAITDTLAISFALYDVPSYRSGTGTVFFPRAT